MRLEIVDDEVRAFKENVGRHRRRLAPPPVYMTFYTLNQKRKAFESHLLPVPPLVSQWLGEARMQSNACQPLFGDLLQRKLHVWILEEYSVKMSWTQRVKVACCRSSDRSYSPCLRRQQTNLWRLDANQCWSWCIVVTRRHTDKSFEPRYQISNSSLSFSASDSTPGRQAFGRQNT